MEKTPQNPSRELWAIGHELQHTVYLAARLIALAEAL